MTAFRPVAGLRALHDAGGVRFVLVGGLAGLAAALDDMHARPRGVAHDVPFVLDGHALRDGDAGRPRDVLDLDALVALRDEITESS